MEAMDERRVWQRVRGEPDRVGALRECLLRQGRLWSVYRSLSRRGGNLSRGCRSEARRHLLWGHIVVSAMKEIAL